jgi:hypothetical protein
MKRDIKQNGLIHRLLLMVIATSVAIGFASCRKEIQNDNLKVIAKLKGKEVKFPKKTLRSLTGVSEYDNDNYKILVYVDSLSCTSCILKPEEWRKILTEADTIFPVMPEILFFLQPRADYTEALSIELNHFGFRNPIFIDTENEIGKLNKFPAEPYYRCFLLNRENKIVLVGNPAYSKHIWEVYKRAILNDEE